MLISLSDPLIDSRTVNLFNSFIEAGFITHLIAVGNESGDTITSVDPGSGRLYRRWYNFTTLIKKINFSKNIKIIFACDLYSLPVAGSIKKKTGAKLFYDSREFYFALGPISGQKIKQAVISQIERKYEKNADEIIVSGELDKSVIQNHFNHDKPYSVILNLPPKKDYIKSDKIREKFSIDKNRKIIVYQGMVLPGRGIIPLLKAVGHDSGFAVAILGDGEYMDEVRKFVNSNCLNNQVFFTGKIPYTELHEWTCSADVGAALFEPVSLSYIYAFPNKIFEYMMARIPVLATNLPALIFLREIAPCIEIVPFEQKPEQIRASLDHLLTPDVYNRYRENCEKNSEIYNYDIQKSKFIEYIRSRYF